MLPMGLHTLPLKQEKSYEIVKFDDWVNVNSSKKKTAPLKIQLCILLASIS